MTSINPAECDRTTVYAGECRNFSDTLWLPFESGRRRDPNHFDGTPWLVDVGTGSFWVRDDQVRNLVPLVPAPAVTRGDVERVVHRYIDGGFDELHASRVKSTSDAFMALFSGADPAVHVIHESDLPAAEVDGDHYVTRSERTTRRWPKHGYAWWEEFAQKALAEAACYTSLARLAADREATVDPVEAKAQELWESTREGGAPVAEWTDAHEDAQAQFRILARHVLGQEAGDE